MDSGSGSSVSACRTGAERDDAGATFGAAFLEQDAATVHTTTTMEIRRNIEAE